MIVCTRRPSSQSVIEALLERLSTPPPRWPSHLLTPYHAPSPLRLSNNQTLLGREIISRHLQIQRRGPLPRPPTDIVMTPMARAEPAPEITRLANRHTAQVCADAHHDEPLGFLDAVFVGLGVAEGFDLDGAGVFDFGFGAVADEDGFAAPLDDDLRGGLERRKGVWLGCSLGERGQTGRTWFLRFCLQGLRRGRLRLWLGRGRRLMLTCLRGNLGRGSCVSQYNQERRFMSIAFWSRGL